MRTSTRNKKKQDTKITEHFQSDYFKRKLNTLNLYHQNLYPELFCEV